MTTSLHSKEQMKNPYPANDLGVVFKQLARLIEGTEKKRFSGRAQLLNILGFAEGSGAGNNIISSLIHYGLLLKNQDEYVLSVAANQFAHTDPADPVWKRLAIDALTTPSLFKKLFDRFGFGELSSNIELTLNRGYKVKAGSVDKVIRNYKKSIEFITAQTDVAQKPKIAPQSPPSESKETPSKTPQPNVEVDFGDGMIISVPKRLILDAYLNELQKKGWLDKTG